MKKYLIIMFIFILVCVPAKVFGYSTSADGVNDALTQTDSFSISTCCWMGGDLAQVENGTGIKVPSDNSCDLSAGLFGMIDVSSAPLPCLIALTGNSYFVTVLGEQKVTFSVNYQDNYSNVPSTGYPRVTYWLQGTSNYQTLALSLCGTNGTCYSYSATVSLPGGVYCYQYAAKNDNYPTEYDLAQSSFVVASKPPVCSNQGIANSSVVSNGKVVLRWVGASGSSSTSAKKAMAANGDTYYYNLYFGTNQNSLPLLYSGTSTYYEIDALDFSKQYYWQVETVNEYGLSSKTQVFDFTTIKENKITKAFNYPNPFNPAKNETTSIVFDMKEAGFAEIDIYSEYGKLCWQKTVYDLPKGANEVKYDGKDESGNIMYSGTYPCIVKKKYPDREEKDKCRILIIK